MRFKIPLILIIVFLSCLGWADLALSFGISPPRVFNDHLVPGAHFEQTIILTQAEPKQPLKIKVIIDAPEIEDWIEIQPGKEFTIPSGRQQFPMRVIVNVPKDAGYDTYQGTITVRAISGERKGQITILTGAVANIRLVVSGEEFSDFKLRGIKVSNIEEGDPIRVIIELENLGNVKVRPSKVYLRIFDQYHQSLLESGEATDMNWVEPFEKGKVTAKMPTKLGIGEYWAEIEIYKKGELLIEDKRKFHIVEKGTIKPYLTFLGRSIWFWILILGIILAGFTSIKFKLWKKLLEKLGISIKVEKIKK